MGRHYRSMKPILCLSLLFSACMWADEAGDRAAIEKVISGFNEPHRGPHAKPLSALFTSDADPAELRRLSDMEGRMRQASDGPWSEVTTPRMVSESIRFVTPDVALVDAVIAQYGSLLVSREPVLLLMKKQATEWRIASVEAWRRRSLFVVCAPCSNSAGHEKRWPAPQLICCTVISWTLH